MATVTKPKRRRGRPRSKQLTQPDYPFTTTLPDGRKLFIEVPGRWVTKDRSGETAFLPDAVRFIDRVVALASKANWAERPPSPGYITTLREALGMTQQELGDKLGVDKMSVSRWERGQIRPSQESLTALEKLRSEAVRKGVVIPG